MKVRIITAKFDSKCTQCGKAIKKGDTILYCKDYGKTYVHCPDCTEDYNRVLAAADFDEQVYNY